MHQQRHNPLAYMKYIIYSKSSQCIIGRFSKTAVFDCLVSGGSLCYHVLAHISCDKSKTGPEHRLFSVKFIVNDFLTDFMRRLKSSDRLDGN